MNRRAFLSTLALPFIAPYIPAQKPIPGTWGAVTRSTEPLFRNVPLVANRGLDKNTMYFLSSQLWIMNPASCAVIRGISEPNE